MLTQAQLDALKTTLVARFTAGLALSPDDWKKVAGLIRSNGKSNTYAWLTQFPAFREWVGSRLHKKLAEKAYTVVNKKFETTIDVERTDVEDDSFGHYGDVAEGHGQAAKDLMNDIIFQALAAGFTATCYDDQFFFDADHPLYANEDGTGTVTQQSNMQAGAGAPWIMLCTKRAPKPIYLQERVKPTLESVTSPQNQSVFDLDVYSFGGRWRGNAAYGFWQCAFGSKAALTKANFDLAYNAMMDFKGDGGRKLGLMADTLVVGSTNRVAAEDILLKQNLANGESNTNYKRLELVVTPWLA
ncbi:Mu-like prophage major head subunit gpT family protein [Rhodoferax sp. BLA1]|uniref:Mu-like prophage major head subunit gpT family protein n=1 Tax=Rhodoferax sp. BLA1 TaxID=2576062 RepID=UPI0015D32C2A|nr:Mu-like prophage major head subunit gpT family protein [Rhodoferax sp. BLA1]